MRRWRKEEDDDDILNFEDLDEPVRGRGARRYLPPERKIITHYDIEDDEDDEESEASNSRFDELEPKIRAGEYKPTSSDPWHAHVLYNLLKDLGKI